MSRKSVVIALLSSALFALLMLVCGFVAEKRHQNREAQCFEIGDKDQRWACIRRS